MEPALKQRLLGAAVIVALAVIIIPFLLDGSGTEPVSEVPLPPEPQSEQRGPLIVDDSVPTPDRAPQSQVIDQYSPPPSPPQAPSAEPSLPAEPTPADPDAGMPKPAPQAAVEPESDAKPETAPAPEPQPAPEQAAPPEPEPSDSAGSAAPSTATATAGWVVQVGSFSEQDKATALQDRLRKQQFKAFVERFQASNGQSMYRVRVGPVPERPEAETLQQKLEAQEKLKGFVTQQQ